MVFKLFTLVPVSHVQALGEWLLLQLLLEDLAWEANWHSGDRSFLVLLAICWYIDIFELLAWINKPTL